MDNAKRQKIIIRTSLLGILGNLILVAAKATIGLLSNSIAIITDAINNLTDAISSIVTIIGTKLANKAPNKKHPFGYGRIEYVTNIIIAIIILFAGFSAIYESINSIIKQEVASYNYISIITISIAIAVKIILGLLFRHYGKIAKSDTLSASGLDALLDALLSSSTLIAIIISLFAKVNIEGYLGIFIGLFIIKAGIGVLRQGLSAIVGERADPELVTNIKKEMLNDKEVKGVYDLIINSYGPNHSIASAHIEVRDDMNAKQLHQLTRQLTTQIYLKYGVIMTIGIYASNITNDRAKEIKEAIIEIIGNYPHIKQLHGYYLNETTRTISFDLVFDYDDKDKDSEISEIKNKIKNRYPEYDYYVIIDNDYSV